MRRIAQKIFNFFYVKHISRKHGIKMGKGVYVNRNSFFEGGNALGNKATIMNSSIGYGSYISENSSFKNCKVGRFCSIGPNVTCVFGKHPTSKFVSTHPSFFSTQRQAGFSFTVENVFDEYEKPADPEGKYAIVIGNDVWLGAGIMIMDGVTIGDGAIVAAGALVVKDVAPYSIVGGVPAKEIRKRFDSETITFLQDFKWWEKDIDWIQKNAKAFRDVKAFKKNFL